MTGAIANQKWSWKELRNFLIRKEKQGMRAFCNLLSKKEERRMRAFLLVQKLVLILLRIQAVRVLLCLTQGVILSLLFLTLPKTPHADDQNFAFSSSGIQSLCDFVGDKGESSSQGDGLLPIQEPNPSLNLHDAAIGNKVDENVEATSCHEMVQNNLCSHPLIPKLGVKVVNPIGLSSPLVDSPTTYTRKKEVD